MARREVTNAYRDGEVHVLVEQCKTCVFRPGNLMQLQTGRLKDLVDSNLKADSALVCHDTLYKDGVDNAVCRGYFDAYADEVTPLRLAQAMGIVVYDPLASQPRDGNRKDEVQGEEE